MWLWMPLQMLLRVVQRQRHNQKVLQSKIRRYQDQKEQQPEQPLVVINCLETNPKVTHLQVPAATLPVVAVIAVIAVTAASQEAPVLDSERWAL